MTKPYHKIGNRRRCLREAEGYLELATQLDDRIALDQAHKTRLADLCLAALYQIDGNQRGRAPVLYLSGQAHRLAGRYRQAITDLQSAWELNSLNIHTCLALGWCYKRTGQMEQAITSLQNGLQLDSNCGILHYNLACYLALEHRAEMSLVHLARAIEIDPGYRRLAADEVDFDGIRNDPGFRELAEVMA